MLAMWRTPHTFGLIPIEGDQPSLPPMAAITYGPVAADLLALRRPTLETVVRLGRTLGFEWLASLATIDPPTDHNPPPTLATFLNDRYSLRPGVAPNPFGIRAGELVRRHPQPIPTDVLTEFAALESGRLAYIGTTLRYLLEPLLRPLIPQAQPATREEEERAEARQAWAADRAAVLLTALGSPIKLRRLRDPTTSTTIYAHAPHDLYTRALLETVELYNERPPLALCSRCRRLFVPRRKDEKHCRRHIWPVGGEEQIAGCVFDDNRTATRANLDARAHRTAYKRHQMRVIRATEAHGPNHQKTQEARKTFDQWKQANPAELGRRPAPSPPYLVPN